MGDAAAGSSLLLRAGSRLRGRLAAVRRRFRREPPPDVAEDDADGAADPETQWFRDHYETAPGEIEAFLAAAGVTLEGRAIADVGCGDGIMALGLAHRTHPAALVGFDIVATDREALAARARRHGVEEELPETLEFRQSEPTRIPAADSTFDVVYTWSAFEHIAEPVTVLREIRRILKPAGVMMLQLWPFYFSAPGSHLWEWFPEPFHHLLRSDEDLVAAMRRSGRHPDEWTEYIIGQFVTLNRITLDELHRAILDADMEVRKLQVLGEAVDVPAEANRYPLSQLGISGVKLLATPVGGGAELIAGPTAGPSTGRL